MRPPPLTSTLFPYTTLFRSSVLSSNLAGFELQRLKPGAIRLIVILKGLANGSPLLAPIHSNHHSFILHNTYIPEARSYSAPWGRSTGRWGGGYMTHPLSSM